MKITLPNGMTLEGTTAQVQDTIKALNISMEDGVHYLSESKGYVRIDEMNTEHIRNALLKLYRAWAERLDHCSGINLVTVLRNGPNDVTIVGLFKEYTKRHVGKD